jgi:hypothetical protein
MSVQCWITDITDFRGQVAVTVATAAQNRAGMARVGVRRLSFGAVGG